MEDELIQTLDDGTEIKQMDMFSDHDLKIAFKDGKPIALTVSQYGERVDCWCAKIVDYQTFKNEGDDDSNEATDRLIEEQTKFTMDMMSKALA